MEEIRHWSTAREPLRRRDGRLSLDISDQVEFCPYRKSQRVELDNGAYQRSEMLPSTPLPLAMPFRAPTPLASFQTTAGYICSRDRFAPRQTARQRQGRGRRGPTRAGAAHARTRPVCPSPRSASPR